MNPKKWPEPKYQSTPPPPPEEFTFDLKWKSPGSTLLDGFYLNSKNYISNQNTLNEHVRRECFFVSPSEDKMLSRVFTRQFSTSLRRLSGDYAQEGISGAVSS